MKDSKIQQICSIANIGVNDMEEMEELEDIIFEFELMASDKCNGSKTKKYKQISDWLKELKELKKEVDYDR